MLEIEMSVEELLNIIESKKEGIKKTLENLLQQQIDFFCGNKINKRPLNLSFKDIKDENGNPIQNAYAIF